MNRRGEQVNKAQLRENERCLREYQRDKLSGPMAFNTCATTADHKDKVQKAKDRTLSEQKKKCDTLTPPPPFAYTNAATVNTAAMDAALWMNYVIFGGPPVDDDNLVMRAQNISDARCQLEMLKRGDQLENTVLKEINNAKRRALRDKTTDSAAALEAALQAVFTSNKRITRTQDRLVRSVDGQCAVLQVPPATAFPGECGTVDATLRQVEVCVIKAARCEACLKINAFDALNMDCDQADDQITNGSCP